MTGYTLDEIGGQNPDFLYTDLQEESFLGAMRAALEATGRWQGELTGRRKNGEIYSEWRKMNAIYNEDGSVHRWVTLFSDITPKKKSDELIWEQANFDSLTRLPNRHMFHNRLEQEIKKADRSGASIALLLLDLDHFREVNDSLGHGVAPEQLRARHRHRGTPGWR